jgi:DNA polymerase III epsilon subunit-like protein
MARLLVIDTETGGTDPLVHSLLSLAGVVWTDGASGTAIEMRVAESAITVTPKAMGINRIDLAAYGTDALPPDRAVEMFEAFVRGAFRDEFECGDKVVLAGHNVGFDIGFLKRLYRLAGADFDATFSHRALDTAGVLRFLSLAGLRKSSDADLTTALAEMRIPVEKDARHSALGDASATALLLTRLLAFARSSAHSPAPRTEAASEA